MRESRPCGFVLGNRHPYRGSHLFWLRKVSPVCSQKISQSGQLTRGWCVSACRRGAILGAESRKFAGFSVWPVLRPRCLTALQIGDLCNDPTPEIRLMFFNSIDRTGLLCNRKSPRRETAPRPSTRSGNALIPREGCDFLASCKVHFLWFSRNLYSLSLVWSTLPCRRSRHRANLHASELPATWHLERAPSRRWRRELRTS